MKARVNEGKIHVESDFVIIIIVIICRVWWGRSGQNTEILDYVMLYVCQEALLKFLWVQQK